MTDGSPSGGAGRPGLTASRFREIALEAFLIVFAVLIALTAEEWWEDREREARGRTALAAIVTELESNRRQIVSNVAPNDTTWAVIDTALDEGRVAGASHSVSVLRDDVWGAVRQNGATETVDVRLLARISEVYGVQENYLDRQNQLLDHAQHLLALNRIDTPLQERLMALSEVWAADLFRRTIECYLLRGLDVVIEEIESGVVDPRTIGDILDEKDEVDGPCAA